MKRSPVIRAIGAALLLSGSGLAACAPPTPPSAVIEDRVTTVATVESIDMRSRDVLLRGPNGGLFTVKAGPEVQNLAQVRPGDRVYIAYQEALAVQVSPPGQMGPPSERDTAAVRAARGERPAGAGYDMIRVRVKIEAVDRSTNTVSFIGPQGVLNIVAVRNPEMIAFIRRLRPGDEVELNYVEAVAISVEPAPAAAVAARPGSAPPSARRR